MGVERRGVAPRLVWHDSEQYLVHSGWYRRPLPSYGSSSEETLSSTFFGELLFLHLLFAMAPKEEREVAPMPARVATTNLPILPPFDNADSIVQALSSREVPVLTAGELASVLAPSRRS